MPSKKKKYNARFPPARIKKIMQTDEDVGKVAAAVPVIISRALELFIDSLIEKTAAVTRAKNAKTLSSSHIKQAIQSEKTFDFLQDLVKNVPDHQTEEEMDNAAPSGSGTVEKKPKVQRPRKPREEGARGPGRPRKVKVEEKKESASEPSDEETETDEEQTAEEETSQLSQSNNGQTSTTSDTILSPVGQYGLQPQPQISPGMPVQAVGNCIPPQSPLSIVPVMSIGIPTSQITSLPHIQSPPLPGTSVNIPVTNIEEEQPRFSAQYPTHTQGQPILSPGQQQQQQQQGVPGVPAGYPNPMHNMGYSPYPFMARGPPVPFIHPQTSPDHPLPPNAGMHVAYNQPGIQQYPPPHFLPPHPAYMMSQMETKDPRFMAPSGGVPMMPMGPPQLPPMFSMKQNESDNSEDTSMPLDMSLSGKSKQISSSSESTGSSNNPCISQMTNSELYVSKIPQPQGLPHWNFYNQNNQNVMVSTVSNSQIMGPPPLIGSTETQSSSPVTENGRHKQNNTGDGKQTTEPKTLRNPSADKTVSFPGLANIMNMKPVKTNVSEDNDDDYDS